MKKTTQANLSIFCLFLMAKTTFASEVNKFSSLQKSEKLRINVGEITGFGGTKPGTIPKTFDPEGLNNISPFKPKIPGHFSSPQAELSKGNFGQAKVACIQSAIEDGVDIPNLGASSAWEFAAKDLPKSPPILLQKGSSVAFMKLRSSSTAPKAFAKKEMCGSEKVRHSACANLLSKSMNEIPQAYYKSEVTSNPEVWDEIAAFLGIRLLNDDTGRPMDLKESLIEESKKHGRESTLAMAGALNSFQSQDQLLLATSLLISKIDEALSRGDSESSDRAKALLKRINPSAEYSVKCILSNVAKGGLNDDLDPSGRPAKGTIVGPLSGVDYGAQSNLITHGWVAIAVAVAAIITVGIQAADFAREVNKDNKDEAFKKSEQDDRQKMMAMDQMSRFLACEGPDCAAAFPEAAATLEKANEAKKVESTTPKGTNSPAKPVEKAGDDMWAPSVKPDPIPGNGGAGGELLPPDWNVVELESAHKVKIGSEVNTRLDPEAAQRFCTKIVRDYKSFASRKITGSGRLVETSLFPIAVGEEMGRVEYGVAAFDHWDAKFWREQIEIYKNEPANRAKENACNSMDPVRAEL